METFDSQLEEVFERARLSRDARFDGRFFVGVRTTGIYCRPVCPANAPKRENIRFFPSAAAAGEAGLRPCLRCRPEAAPGSPAWNGTSTTVRRALRLIENGALDDGGIEVLSDRLGVTSRHLRRLFQKHLGASPLSVAHTQRLHFAKRLIDDTCLPMTEIAMASGFRSIRRFNDTFRKTYQRSPRDLRRQSAEPSPDSLTVRMSYRKPFDWQRLLAFFGPRVTPGVEYADEERYLRSVSLGDESGVIEVSQLSDSLEVRLHGLSTTSLFPVVQRLRALFDVDAPVADIAQVLSADPLLASCLARTTGLRVPGAWDGYELAVRAILGQQVSVQASTTLASRLAARYGEQLPELPGELPVTRLFPTPDKLKRARMNNLGLVGSRAATIRELSKAVANGSISLGGDADPESVRRELKLIKGIGDWTAEYVSMRACKDPDAFPASDLGLLRALDSHMGRRISARELAELSTAWRPWRAYAALLLWSHDPGSGG